LARAGSSLTARVFIQQPQIAPQKYSHKKTATDGKSSPREQLATSTRLSGAATAGQSRPQQARA
jgi:hypothetical protein